MSILTIEDNEDTLKRLHCMQASATLTSGYKVASKSHFGCSSYYISRRRGHECGYRNYDWYTDLHAVKEIGRMHKGTPKHSQSSPYNRLVTSGKYIQQEFWCSYNACGCLIHCIRVELLFRLDRKDGNISMSRVREYETRYKMMLDIMYHHIASYK